jgi:hypothetical protein
MTFLRNICKRFKDLDIVVYYKTCESDEQLQLLKRYVKVVKYTNQKIKCKKIFFNKAIEIIDNVEAEEICMILHTNYKNQIKYGLKPCLDKRITKYYGVSKLVCDTFEEMYGIKAEPLYTPIELETPKKLLRLVSFTRLDTDDKCRNNYIQFASLLDDANIPYQWLIFTPDKKPIDKKGVCLMKPVLDISSYLKDAHYLVQLSENLEGFSLTTTEALSLGVPIISTQQDVYKELGIDSKYGFILDSDLTNVPIEKIYEKAGTFNFTKKPPVSNWDKVLVPGKSKYEDEKGKLYTVEALDTYRVQGIADAELRKVPEPGDRWSVDSDRLAVLLGDNELGLQYVKVVDEFEKPGAKEMKKHKIKVSVVIPVYNQEELIVKAINSIPEREDIEIIVVDDCSTDNTLTVLKSLKRKIKIIANKENKGVGYTFNQGINAAKGFYLIRMDSDDYMYPNMFNELVDYHLDGTDMIYYDLEINNGRILPTTKENRRGRCGTVKFIRRDFIGDTRCPEIRTAEDKYFNDALLAKRPTEKFTNKVLIHYNYPREGSLYNLTMKGELKV